MIVRCRRTCKVVIFWLLLQELKERIERVKEKSNNGRAFTSESEFSEEMMDIRKDFVTIHGEMVLLKNYSSLNFAGTLAIFVFLSPTSNLFYLVLPKLLTSCIIQVQLLHIVAISLSSHLFLKSYPLWLQQD